MAIGYKNVCIVTCDDNNTVYDNGYIIFDSNGIIDIGSMQHFNHTHQDVDWKDKQGYIVMPGMINAHTHLGMIPFRSLGDDTVDRLRRLLFPLEQQAMTKEIVYHSSKYAIAEMFLSGITTFCDMYYFEDDVALATQEMGARALLGETIINQVTPDSQHANQGLTYAESFIQKWQNHSLITPMIAPHAPNTNDEQTLKQIVSLSKRYNVPITMHVSEMTYEIDYFKQHYNVSPVQYLHQLGFFNCPFIMAHCILTSYEDLVLISQHANVSIAHCIGANTKSAKGVAPLKVMQQLHIPVGLGTDGPSSGNTLDMFTQMKLVANFHKTTLKDRGAFPAREIVQLTTHQAAKALHLNDKVGSLEIGKQADIVVLETESLNMFPIFDVFATIVYAAQSHNVYDVFVAGKQVVFQKQLCHVNLSDLKQNLKHAMTIFNQIAHDLLQ